mgnify:FL=1
MSTKHNTETDGPLPAGAWEDLGDNNYRKIEPAKPAKKKGAKGKD